MAAQRYSLILLYDIFLVQSLAAPAPGINKSVRVVLLCSISVHAVVVYNHQRMNLRIREHVSSKELCSELLSIRESFGYNEKFP